MSEKEIISMIIYSIYKVVNRINGKIYIGFDSDWPNRLIYHYYNSRSKSKNYYIYRAIRKYGWENFSFDLIYQSKDREYALKIMEPFFIKEYNSFENGYNMTSGGEGTFGKKQSLENKTKQSRLISERNKKSNWYNNGKQNTFSIEHPGNGWSLGRLNQKPTTKGYKWFNNGKEQLLTNNPPNGWSLGMLKRNTVL
jgi:group I intron endonuclease